MIASGSNVDPSKEKRDSLILNENGLITVTGGKLTTFRSTAIAALKKAAEAIPGLEPAGAGAALFAPPAASTLDALSDLPADLRERWLSRYGDAAAAVKACAAPGELQTIRHTGTTLAELRWACRSEDVVHLDDLLLRRTRLGLLLRNGAEELLPNVRPIAGAGTRLERRALERGGRGLPDLDRALLRDPTGASVSVSSDELLLAIDCGTQSVRALLFDLKGDIAAKRQQTLERLYIRARGVARARRRGLLAGERVGLPQPLVRKARPQVAHQRRCRLRAARLSHPGRRQGQTAASLHHLARSAARSSHAAHSTVVARRVYGGGRQRHDRLPRDGIRAELDRGARARTPGARP